MQCEITASKIVVKICRCNVFLFWVWGTQKCRFLNPVFVFSFCMKTNKYVTCRFKTRFLFVWLSFVDFSNGFGGGLIQRKGASDSAPVLIQAEGGGAGVPAGIGVGYWLLVGGRYLNTYRLCYSSGPVLYWCWFNVYGVCGTGTAELALGWLLLALVLLVVLIG